MEFIKCSAVWYKDLPLQKPEVLERRGYRPYNVNKGIVFCGWRHSNCIYQMAALTGLSDHQAGHGEQGFLTNQNRFVDRIEGAKIALKCGQITKLEYSKDTLYSEDLY
jgi:hypothetical protein